MQRFSTYFSVVVSVIFLACNSTDPFEESPIIVDAQTTSYSLESVSIACGSQNISNFSWIEVSVENAISNKDPKYSYSARLVEFELQNYIVLQETWIDGKGGTSVITCNYTCSGVLGLPDSIGFEEYMDRINVLESIYTKTGTAKNPTY